MGREEMADEVRCFRRSVWKSIVSASWEGDGGRGREFVINARAGVRVRMGWDVTFALGCVS